MKLLIVLSFIFSGILLSQPGDKTPPAERSSSEEQEISSDSEEETEPGTPVGRGTFDFEIDVMLEVTPSTLPRPRAEAPVREIRVIGPTRVRDVQNAGILYMITTRGAERMPGVPIWDFRGRFLTNRQIEEFIREVTQAGQTIAETDFNFYFGITTENRLMRRRSEHVRATRTHPRRRLPTELLTARRGHMHLIARGVHPANLAHLEARLIRAFGATGLRGLNGNAGHLGTPERGVAGLVELTPGTATPGRLNGRNLVRLEEGRLLPVAVEDVPLILRDVLYLITPPMTVTLPIIDLQHMHFEHYIGQVTAGTNGERSPQTRANEHARASVEHPYRRLQFGITRTNQATAQPVHFHALFNNVHPNQINMLEAWLIQVFGGLNQLSWNSNAGHGSVSSPSTSSHRRDRDPDAGPGFGLSF